ncbi:MAG: hypothetical protein IKH27_11000 [Oscillospiraceae bacterium]|nr:hypothetical protein [Oscillospiraceae bacterium]MBR3448323.1 hypothetical protein [Oscillospiraceae bacterium]
MFKSQRYVTRGVNDSISQLIQTFIWNCIDRLPENCDYLQVFRLEPFGRMQQIRHTSEQPEHQMLYMLPTDELVCARVYVIDSDDYSTMLLAEEY